MVMRYRQALRVSENTVRPIRPLCARSWSRTSFRSSSASYKVIAKPAKRAFAGLSMGGHHALTVALNHHDKFGWIGAFSSAPPPTNTIAAGLSNPGAVNRDLKLFWIACGKKDFLFKRNGEFTTL